MKKIIIFLCFLCYLSPDIFAQTSEDFRLLTQEEKSSTQETWAFARNISNEYDLLFSSLFLFYKNFISSQDASHCTFTPSCSVYALQAIKQEGPVVGIINFFDRFSRCNGVSPEAYPHDSSKNNLLIDPVRNLRYE